jgi:glycosyltransferase involved in cell wall biosynthesis
MKARTEIIVIDATNIGGGGGVTHLKEILAATDPKFFVAVIAQQKVLKQLPHHARLALIAHQMLEKTLLHRVFFQLFLMDRMIPADAVVFAVSGDFLGRHKPVVSMSQNMLLYEREIWKDIRSFRERMRFWINFYKQRRSFRNSRGIIFISEYAREYISKRLNLNGKEVQVIHHGISPRFMHAVKPQKPLSAYTTDQPFRFLYVSTVHVYKHQWNVVEAVGKLRRQGYPVALDLVGGVLYKPAGRKLEEAIRKTDPAREFIFNHGDIPYEEVDRFYSAADGIVFASTCENMPIILLESMASGTPVACSNKQPMPEFLKDYGFYFDALEIDSIAGTLKEFLESPEKRAHNAQNALREAETYRWEDAGKKTFDFILQF